MTGASCVAHVRVRVQTAIGPPHDRCSTFKGGRHTV
jgi:hypothetical protein